MTIHLYEKNCIVEILIIRTVYRLKTVIKDNKVETQTTEKRRVDKGI